MSYTLAYTGAEIDALLGKIDAIFVAEYGSTIYAEVTAAIAAGNKVIVANAGKVYVYAGQDDNSGYVFTQSGPNAAKPNATYVTLSTGNVWSTATVDLATVQQFYASLMEDTLEDIEIASFPDGANDVPVESLVVKIEAMQAGSGDPSPDNIRPIYSQALKNKIDLTVESIKAANSTATWVGNTATMHNRSFTILTNDEGVVTGISVSGTSDGSNAFFYVSKSTALSGGDYIINGCPAGGSAGTYRFFVDGYAASFDEGNGATFSLSEGTYSPLISISSAQGALSGLVFKPMIRDAANPDPTFVPYRCVARVDEMGKNILDPIYFSYPSVYSVSGDVVNILAGDNRPWVDLPILPLSAGTYTLSRTNTACSFAIRTSEDGYATSIEKGAGQTSITFTLSVDGGVKIKGGFGTATYPVACSFQLELAPTATPYEARKDRTYFVMGNDTSPTEIYGGGLNVTTGELKVTDGIKVYDGSADEDWTLNGDAQFWIQNNSMTKLTDYTDVLMCNRLTIAANHTSRLPWSISGYGNMTYPNQNWLYVQTVGLNTAEDFKTWLAANNLQVVYPLATPQIFHLDPVEVKTWLANNNIICNTGKIKLVVYRCNTALYIQKMLEA